MAEVLNPKFEALLEEAMLASLKTLSAGTEASKRLDAALAALADSGDTGAARLANLARGLAERLSVAESELDAIVALVEAADQADKAATSREHN